MPKVLSKKPAHTISFIVFCNGVESGFMARAYEPSSLTRNSQAGPCTDGPGHNDSSSSSPLAVAGPGRPGVTPFILRYALRPANCPAAACQQGRSHWQAPLPGPVRAASKLEMPGPACHLEPGPGIPSQGPRNPSDPKGALGPGLSPRRISDTSRRQVTRPSRAE